jgi:CBS domain-containing protein
MTVRDAMSSELIVVRETDSALAGLKLLLKEGVGGAPVVSKESRLVGMVTEFDLLLAIDFVGEEVPISRVMHADVISVGPDASLDDARDLMITHHHRRLPVIEGDRVIGILSRRDVLRIRFGL